MTVAEEILVHACSKDTDSYIRTYVDCTQVVGCVGHSQAAQVVEYVCDGGGAHRTRI